MSEKDQIFNCLLESATSEFSNFAALFEHNGPLPVLVRKENDLFKFLVRTLISQQLSSKAADSIWRKLIDTSCEEELYDCCVQENKLKLRSAGLSNNKINAIFHLKQAFKSNQISSTLMKKSDHNKIHELVTQVWGFGEWSADMTSIFYSCNSDIWPTNDLALERGIKHLAKCKLPSSKIAEKFMPFRTYFALHIWKGIDSGYI